MSYSVIRHASTSLTLPTQSDVMSPRASMGSNNREVILKFVLNNKWTSRHHIQPIDRAPSLDVIKKDIKFVGDRNVEGLPVVWNEAKLDLMARNALNQINSCIANFKDPLRHSSIDESEVIDVRDDEFLEHKNTNNVEHAEYVFDRDAFGNGISWYAVATNSISFAGMAVFRKSGAFFDTGDNYIRVHVPGDRHVKIENIQQLKNEIGKQVKSKLPTGATVSSQELAKAAAFLWAQYTDYLNSIRKKDLSHSYEIIDVRDDEVLEHASRHEGYYSPNYTDKKATPYIYDTLVKSSDGRQIGMRFKGVGDREWVIIYVPSVDFTPTYNNIIKLINDNKDISNRKVVIRENEKAKAARIVTNFFNSPSVAGNEKMTTFVKKPQHLKRSSSVSHALFTEVYDMDDYLEHHGILGQKWGVRRFQNADGSLTSAGAKRYGVNSNSAKDISSKNGIQNRLNDLDAAMVRNRRHSDELYDKAEKYDRKAQKWANSNKSNADVKKDEYERKAEEARIKKKEYDANNKKGMAETNELIAEAKKLGLKVDETAVKRSVAEMRDMPAIAIKNTVGLALAMLTGFGFITGGPSLEGTKYKVRTEEEAKKSEKKAHTSNAGLLNTSMSVINQQNMNQFNQQNMINQQMMQMSISQCNQAASLATTCGMNPFLFGV